MHTHDLKSPAKAGNVSCNPGNFACSCTRRIAADRIRDVDQVNFVRVAVVGALENKAMQRVESWVGAAVSTLSQLGCLVVNIELIKGPYQ
jgi:hypothetical protein